MPTKEFMMDLQLFAEAGEGTGTEGTEGTEGAAGAGEGDNQEFFTKAEVDAMLQKESDRRVSAARKKFETELKTTVEKERREAEKLAKMSEEDKAKHTFEDKERLLNERESLLLQKELKLEAAKILGERKLPTTFVDLLANGDAEETLKNIEVFEGAFRDAVSAAVDERLGQTSTRPGAGTSGTVITRDEFKKLGYRERLTLMNKDPELYNKLSQENDN